jgi:hypothetical protein
MASSLFTKLSQFANSPQGKRAVRQFTEKAQELARDPKNRARVDEIRRRFPKGRGRGGATHGR